MAGDQLLCDSTGNVTYKLSVLAHKVVLTAKTSDIV